MRDITLEDTIYIGFSTRAFATGIPTTLAGTPVVSAYEDAGLTQITAGITLGVDHDSVTGLHMLTIVATAANGYENGKDYNLVITTGTVDSVSVVGEVVGGFTIGRSAAAVDLANGTDGLGALKTLIDTVNTDLGNGTDGLGALKTLIDTVNTDLSNGTDGLGALKTLLDAVATTADLLDKLGAVNEAAAAGDPSATESVIQYVKQIVNILIGTTGIVTWPAAADPANGVSIAEALRRVFDDTDAGGAGPWTTGSGTGLTPLASGTAQGGTASTIQLAASETFANDELNGNVVKITSGTGKGQSRVITDYVGATDTATVKPDWTTNPDATSVYEVVDGSVNLDAIQLDDQSATDLKDFADAGYDPAANKVQGVVLVDTCTANTDVRGTDSAALASVCTEARLAELDAANLPADVAAIPTTAMRGTDSAALASVCTESRLAELDAANLPADVAAIPTTAMRGTDSAALASVCTEARLSELDAANLATDIANVQSDTDNIQTRLPAALVSGRMDSDVRALQGQTGASNRIARLFQGGQHSTAQAGTANTITLNAGADSNDDFFNGQTIVLSDFTGKRQCRLITDYNGTTKVATISPNWVVNPDATTEYVIVCFGPGDIQRIEGADPTDQIRDALVDDATRFSGADIATILADTDNMQPKLGSPAGASISADIAAVKSETALTVADTNELQTDDVPTLIAAVQADTDDIQTRLPAALVGGRMDANASAINNNNAAAIRLALSAGQITPGTVDTVVNTHTPTTTVFQADDITEATADHFNGRLILWTSGVLIGQMTDITDYVAVGGIGQFTVTAMTEAPANNDTFIIV